VAYHGLGGQDLSLEDRVSTSEQDTATQVAALKTAGCERIFREKASQEKWHGG
jgi:hypothetical protein